MISAEILGDMCAILPELASEDSLYYGMLQRSGIQMKLRVVAVFIDLRLESRT